MKRRALPLMLVMLVPAAGAQRAENGRDETVIIAEGAAAVGVDMAASEEEAIWAAKRAAVQQVAGMFFRSRTVAKDLDFADTEYEGRVNGYIRKWEIVPGSRRIEPLGKGNVIRIRIQAAVALLLLIRSLEDIREIYQELERPRLRIESFEGDSADRARGALVARLTAEGYDVTKSEAADIILAGRVDIVPTVRLGQADSPFGIGQHLAVSRARLGLTAVSVISDEVLFAADSEGAGESFASDEDAASDARRNAAEALFGAHREPFARSLLVRWARERYEGHEVAIRVAGLDAPRRAVLKDAVREMRGFVKLRLEAAGDPYELRFTTQLDNAGIRRRLSGLSLLGVVLTPLDHRGPIINCRVEPAQRSAGKR